MTRFTFVAGEDLRCGDLLEVDPATGCLVRRRADAPENAQAADAERLASRVMPVLPDEELDLDARMRARLRFWGAS